MRVCPGCRATYDDSVGFCQDDGLPLIEVSQTFARPAVSQDGPTLPPLQLEAGMMVGEYQIEHHIATGGMGAIYAGIHPVISKRVAIKVLDRRLAHDPRTLSRFVLEARSVNQIGHHNIVDIFSIGELDDGRAYLIMELLDGLPLHHLIGRAGRLDPGHVLPIYQQLCDALRAAHAKSFVHRDLKPDNIVVLRRPPHPFIKILDFGIAKLRHGDAGDDEATAVGTVLGTPEYMAPEQCRGDEIDHRVDIYALGVMLYELVCGQKPFSDPNPMRVLAAQLRIDPTPPSKHVELPPGLEQLILKAMAKNRDDRFASVAELIAALMQVITTIKPWTLDLSPLGGEASEPTQPPEPSPRPSPPPAVPRAPVAAPPPVAMSAEEPAPIEVVIDLTDDGDDDASEPPPTGAMRAIADEAALEPASTDEAPDIRADVTLDTNPPLVPSDAGDDAAPKAMPHATTEKQAKGPPVKQATTPGLGPTLIGHVDDIPPPSTARRELSLDVRISRANAERPPEGISAGQTPRRFEVLDVDVPAPLMISGEHSFDLDELSRLAPDEEEQTVTAIVDPEHAAAMPDTSDRAKGDKPDSGRRPSPFPETPALAPESIPLTPAEPLVEQGTDSELVDFICPDDAVIGQTAIEEEPLLGHSSSSEMVIEHSLQDQMEQARSMQQQAAVRRVQDHDKKKDKDGG